MAVFTDGKHLVADTIEELHAFAKSIHIHRCWFDGNKKKHPHYDLYKIEKKRLVRDLHKLERALANGAELVNMRQVLIVSKQCYEKSICSLK